MVQAILPVLVQMGVLKEHQVDMLKKEAESAGTSLQTYLLEKEIVSQKDLAKAYGVYFSIPYIETITEKMTDQSLLARVQFHFLRQNLVMPAMYDDTLVIVTSNPFDIAPIDELSLLLGKHVGQAVATGAVIMDAINKFYPLQGATSMMEELEEDTKLIEGDLDLGQVDEHDVLSMASKTPVIKLVNHILFQAVKKDASDIHVEPYEKEVRIRYRIDGVMVLALTPPKRIQSALISRLKIMAQLDIAEKRKPLDGRIEIKVAGKEIDIRVSVLPCMYGERVVMRLLDKSKTFMHLDKLGFSARDFKVVQQAIAEPNGIMLVTGPTGSGKTTTLYAILSKLNSPLVNIITVEDPVEYQVSGINQVQVNEKVGLTFAIALRAILRQDPDIVMIGETRDVETAQIAIQASLTGHLVLSTLHTNSSAATITRLIDMGIEPFLISSTITAVLAQRLVRKLCDSCKKTYQPPANILHVLGISQERAKKIIFYQAVGCSKCGESGYLGRIPIFEAMQVTNAIAKLILERADARQIQKQAIADGMTVLIQDGLVKIEAGITTVEEVLSVAASQEDGGQ